MTGGQDRGMGASAPPRVVAQPLKRILWMAAGWAGMVRLFGGAAAIPVAAAKTDPYRPPDAVPASWVRYAQLVQGRLQQWLAADDAVAYRFHLFLQGRDAAANTPPAALIVKVWIARDGKVQRVEFAPLRDQQATDDLRAILTQGNIGQPPPHDLLQPIQLKLALKMTS
jgi:hypothetical protein